MTRSQTSGVPDDQPDITSQHAPWITSQDDPISRSLDPRHVRRSMRTGEAVDPMEMLVRQKRELTCLILRASKQIAVNEC